MKNKFNIFIYLILCLSISFLNGGTEGQIRGKVGSIEGEPLIGAQVYIEELGIGAVADLDGNYILINVKLHILMVVKVQDCKLKSTINYQLLK